MRRNTLRQFWRVFIFVAVVVNERGAGFQSFDRIIDVRELLVLNIDQSNRLFRDLLIIGRHRRHRIAAHPDFVVSQDRLVLHARADVNIFNVRAGQHGAHAFQRLCFGSIDIDDPRVRHRSAQNFSPEQIFERQVRRVS